MRIISIPWRAGPRGYFAKAPNRRAEIEERMRQLIFTNPHERFMRNDLGVPLMDFIFEPVDEIFSGLAETYIKAMVHKWIEDVRIADISVKREDVETSTTLDTVVTIQVFWTDLKTQEKFESSLQNSYGQTR